MFCQECEFGIITLNKASFVSDPLKKFRFHKKTCKFSGDFDQEKWGLLERAWNGDSQNAYVDQRWGQDLWRMAREGRGLPWQPGRGLRRRQEGSGMARVSCWWPEHHEQRWVVEKRERERERVFGEKENKCDNVGWDWDMCQHVIGPIQI